MLEPHRRSPAELRLVGRLEDLTGALQIGHRDVDVSRTGHAPFGAADYTLRCRMNARLRETLLKELRFSLIRSAGDDVQSRAGSWIRVSHNQT
jgi:hypothetical protein